MFLARRSRLRRIAWSLVGWLLFLAFVELVATRQLAGAVGADFRSFYAAGYMVRTHSAGLYSMAEQARVQGALVSPGIALPYFHPAYEALFYAPFSLVPYALAYRLAVLCNVLLLGCVLLALPELRVSRFQLLRRHPGLLLFAFAPVLMALLQGQDSILFLLLVCLAWRLLRAGREFQAGFVLGLSMFRYQLALPLAGVLALRRGAAFLCGFCVSSALVAGVSVWLTGAAGALDMLHLVGSGSLVRQGGAAAERLLAIHPLAMPNLFGLLHAAGAGSLPPLFATVLVLGVSAAVYLWTARQALRAPSERQVLACAVLVSILVSYHLYLHDLSLLILPFSLVRSRAARIAMGVLYILSFALFLLGQVNALFMLALPVLVLLGIAARPSPQPGPLTAEAPRDVPGLHAAHLSAAWQSRWSSTREATR